MDLKIESAANNWHVRLSPREPEFVQDPYPAYRGNPGMRRRCCSGRITASGVSLSHSDVSALLRDRQFGRQVLHLTTREALGGPEPPAHLEPFNAIERHSLLELEPPEHTRLRGLVNRAFVSRQVERLAPAGGGAQPSMRSTLSPTGARPNLFRASQRQFRSPSSPISSARRGTWRIGWSIGRIAWWRCTSSAGTREAEDAAACGVAGVFRSSCVNSSPSGASPSRRSDQRADQAESEVAGSPGRDDHHDHSATQRRS